MRTTLKFLMKGIFVFTLVFTSCKKNDLADAALLEPIAAENGANGTNGSDGANGSNGNDGTNGTDGANGSDGQDGTDGTNGTDGDDGADGQDGADGEQGAQGEQGPAGPAGADGQDGVDGQAGEDGQDGTDGNANVQVYTYNISDKSGSFLIQPMSQLTQNVIDYDVILGYVKKENRWYPLPLIGNFLPFSIAVNMRKGFYELDFVNADDGTNYVISAGDLDKMKVVVIKSTTTSLKGYTLDFRKMSYEQVMDHFGLVQ